MDCSPYPNDGFRDVAPIAPTPYVMPCYDMLCGDVLCQDGEGANDDVDHGEGRGDDDVMVLLMMV
eukprot:1470584-Pyramimonas_sp.AAC.1